MGQVIRHRALGCITSFDEHGVSVVPWDHRGCRLAWREIDFVSEVPAMARREGSWRTKRGIQLDGLRVPERPRTLTLSFVVHDRRPVLARASGWWNRAWLHRALRPMVDDDDRPKVDQALLEVEVQGRRLDHSLDDLMTLLERRCRFDLVVCF
jgi:hypothetical protein